MAKTKQAQNKDYRKRKKRDKTHDLFYDLKRKFVLNSVFASTLVLTVALASIYFLISNYILSRPMNFSFSISQQPPEMPFEQLPSDNLGHSVDDFLKIKMREDREASLDALMQTLVITGIGLEIMIIFASIIQADKSVQPVREAYENQKAFIANASHEIKTPLAVIQANLEAADIQGNHWIDNVQKKVEDITELNNQLLMLARSEEIGPVKKTGVNLMALIRETANFYEPKADQKGIKLTITGDDNIKKSVNEPGLKQLLNILIDNAIKYGKSKVEITVSETGIRIKNDGKKIEPEKLAHIFERFYQTDKTSDGVGLGLAIAKSLANRNGWKISVKSEKLTEFTLRI
ncbi:MAG: HAMP domain-containing sensor histidine kinase [Candidatus Saccharibacteria bacterium]|nr:HAMP domain-containing sensor histidine kinase [Candidatus Saccharibacteria bacterium]